MPGGWSIVTVGGEIVRAGGAVTGGSAAREQGLLARERERREMVAALGAAETALAAREAALGGAAGEVARHEAARQTAADALTVARRLAGERRGAVGQLTQRVAQTAQEQTWRAGLVAGAEAALGDWDARVRVSPRS